MIVGLIYDATMEGSKMQKQVFHIMRVAKYDVSEFREKAFKMKGKRNHFKIKLWASRSQIFEFLGGCLRGLIFDEFSNGKTPTTN